MELQKQEIEKFRDLYKKVAGEDLDPDAAACMARELVELMKTLTDDYELYIDMPRNG